uniref:Uncharacterized protein n=1 Tax=Rhizophora mucronata TaxID=61149 RepID=A0A2P2PG38_RHIMU
MLFHFLSRQKCDSLHNNQTFAKRYNFSFYF